MRDILERPPPPFDKRVRYGPAPQHFAELRFPDGPGPFPLLFVIHGGFWRSEYDLSHAGHLCAALTSSGIVTCSLEYRRLGDPGGGWPGTFHDISLAVDQILEILSSNQRVDVRRVAVLGHSAGGHLALWVASRHRVPEASPLHYNGRHRITIAVSLAGVCDLRLGFKQNLGNGIVGRFLGGSPDLYPDRYDAGSPIELLPCGSRLLLIHGSADDIVPASQSEAFERRAKRLGERPTLMRLDDTGHFELIDPESSVWPKIAEAVDDTLGLK